MRQRNIRETKINVKVMLRARGKNKKIKKIKEMRMEIKANYWRAELQMGKRGKRNKQKENKKGKECRELLLPRKKGDMTDTEE